MIGMGTNMESVLIDGHYSVEFCVTSHTINLVLFCLVSCVIIYTVSCVFLFTVS